MRQGAVKRLCIASQSFHVRKVARLLAWPQRTETLYSLPYLCRLGSRRRVVGSSCKQRGMSCSLITDALWCGGVFGVAALLSRAHLQGRETVFQALNNGRIGCTIDVSGFVGVFS